MADAECEPRDVDEAPRCIGLARSKLGVVGAGLRSGQRAQVNVATCAQSLVGLLFSFFFFFFFFLMCVRSSGVSSFGFNPSSLLVWACHRRSSSSGGRRRLHKVLAAQQTVMVCHLLVRHSIVLESCTRNLESTTRRPSQHQPQKQETDREREKKKKKKKKKKRKKKSFLLYLNATSRLYPCAVLWWVVR